MTRDKNHFEFTGTVERFQQITTKSGRLMIAGSVRCWRETIRCIAFGDLAETTDLQRGDRVEVVGRIQSNAWTDGNGQQRNGWQVVADTITVIDDDQQQAPPPARTRTDAKPEPRQERMFDQGQRPDPGERFQYTDGPF
jgi:single-stranded DNA-binding protein